MTLLQWNQSLELGHAQIDGEHRKLVEILNRLHAAMQAGNGKDVCGRILGDLLDYTRTHFTAEELLMDAHGYAHTAEHKLLHAKFVRDVLEFKTRFDAGATTMSIAIFRYLKDWLSMHIGEVDRKLTIALKESAGMV